MYAPEEGRLNEMEIFYVMLQKQVQKWNKSNYMIVAADLNGRVERQPIPNSIGIFREDHSNGNGEEQR